LVADAFAGGARATRSAAIAWSPSPCRS